jgi:hypothetical protein
MNVRTLCVHAMKRQSDNATQAEQTAAPWTTPGTQKEAWKRHGNLCDYRAIKASRPAALAISISGPRQFGNV